MTPSDLVEVPANTPVPSQRPPGGLELWRQGDLLGPAKSTLLSGAMATMLALGVSGLVFPLTGSAIVSLGLAVALIGSLSRVAFLGLERLSLALRTSLPMILGGAIQGGILGYLLTTLGTWTLLAPGSSFLYVAGALPTEISMGALLGVGLGACFAYGTSLARRWGLGAGGSLVAGAMVAGGGILAIHLLGSEFLAYLTIELLGATGYYARVALSVFSEGGLFLGLFLIATMVCSYLPFLSNAPRQDFATEGFDPEPPQLLEN